VGRKCTTKPAVREVGLQFQTLRAKGCLDYVLCFTLDRSQFGHVLTHSKQTVRKMAETFTGCRRYLHTCKSSSLKHRLNCTCSKSSTELF